MKKVLRQIFVLLLCCLMAFSAACGSSRKPKPSSSPQTSTSGSSNSGASNSGTSNGGNSNTGTSSGGNSNAGTSSGGNSGTSTPTPGTSIGGGNATGVNVNQYKVNTTEIPLKLQYDEPAPFENEGSAVASMMTGHDIGWQNWSLPIGNGYFGANVFGRTESERIQITEKTLSNPWQYNHQNTDWPAIGGLNNFSETYIDFNHTSVTNYNRYLDLNTATAGVSYKYNNVTYTREYFTSYPDKAMVIRLDASSSGELSFTLRPTIPFKQDKMPYTVNDVNYEADGWGKTGEVVSTVDNNVGCITLSGKLEYYDVDFMGLYRVYINGGTMTAGNTASYTYTDIDGVEKTTVDGTIAVSGATSAYIVFTCGTDYELSSEIFKTSQYDKNKPTASTTLEGHTKPKVEGYLNAITSELSGKSFEAGYTYLKNRHLDDYQELFGRVTADIACNSADFNVMTDDLLASYNAGTPSTYLEVILLQYGRYLLIESSRKGALPANLQGAWNCYNIPAWSSGYWNNINIQMNYWNAFSTNIAETFESYVDFNYAFLEAAQNNATHQVNTYNPTVAGQDNGNGWTIGVSSNPFFINGDRSCGNMGFTTQVYWDYYQYTKDKEVLEVVYDIIVEAAKYVTKCVKEYDGNYYFVEYGDSPEMYVGGHWYYTTGTTYAQSLAYLNNYAALQCAKEAGIDLEDADMLSQADKTIFKTIMAQLDKYDPINIGLSGQIKEFREETYYGSLGNPAHRHISQLVGLFPGNLINSSTDAWLDAALVSINGRNESLKYWDDNDLVASWAEYDQREASIVGWAWAHKAAFYARASEGDKAQEMLAGNLKYSTLQNLLMVCGEVFQVEASCGTSAAIAEMLLQSEEGYIEPIPALPSNWNVGSYNGLVARGNFEVSAAWTNSTLTDLNILSKKGGKASIKYPSIGQTHVYDSNGNELYYEITDNGNIISFDTVAGETYYITGFKKLAKVSAPTDFTYTYSEADLSKYKLSWTKVNGATKYNVYVAYENDAKYSYLGTTASNYLNVTVGTGKENVRKTFAVTAISMDGVESKRATAYFNPINLLSGKAITPSASGLDNIYNADYGYDKLIDGIHFQEGKGRYSSKESGGTVEATIHLGAVYSLSQFKISLYADYQGHEGGLKKAGDGITIQTYNDGIWTERVNVQSNASLADYIVDGGEYDWLVFDLNGVNAEKIMFTIPNSSGYVTFYEMECYGSYVEAAQVNVLLGKEFIATDAAKANYYNSDHSYAALNDGIVAFVDFPGRYSSKASSGIVEARINLGGVYELDNYRIALHGGTIANAGSGITIKTLYQDVWTERVKVTTNSGLSSYIVNEDGHNWLVFNLNGALAEQIMFTIPSASTSGWVTFYEMESYGTYVGESISNILADKEFIPTAEALGAIPSWWSVGYEGLTDGIMDRESEGRFSTDNVGGIIDATVDLEGQYSLDKLKFYVYKGQLTAAGADLMVELYYNGTWTTAINYTNAQLVGYLKTNDGTSLSGYAWLEFDLAGANAQKIRISSTETFSGNYTSFYEVTCSVFA